MDLLEAPKRGMLRDPLHVSGSAPGGLNMKHHEASFEVPRVHDPAAFVASHFSPGTYADNGQRMKFDKGTTTLAFKFQGGVIVSVDSRASQGSYVGSQTVKKVIEISSHLVGTMAGGAADCLFWERNLGMQCRMYELRNKERISVAAASKMLANTMNAYKGMGLSMGTMVAGWDKTGPQLYYVDNDGTRLQADQDKPFFCVGSGGTYAYGVIDTSWSFDMTEDEAVELGKRAIAGAVYRDAYSGGVNNIYVIKETGWDHVYSEDTYHSYDKYSEERRQAANPA